MDPTHTPANQFEAVRPYLPRSLKSVDDSADDREDFFLPAAVAPEDQAILAGSSWRGTGDRGCPESRLRFHGGHREGHCSVAGSCAIDGASTQVMRHRMRPASWRP